MSSEFSGRNGSIYTLGESFTFVVPLRDCGDGWDWRAPKELCCWEPETLSFFWEGEELEPLELHPRTGLVSFSRCLSGSVRASGVGRTAALAATGRGWRMEMMRVAEPQRALGSSDLQVVVKDHGSTAFVETDEIVVGPVLAKLPFAGGTFVGRGNALPFGSSVQITFDPEGVVYEPR